MSDNSTYKYILGEPIGRGTFSQTQRATIAIGNTKLMTGHSQPAILKTLASQLRDSDSFDSHKEHFQTLSQRLANCHHPHLAKVLDYFEEKGQPYIVYEAIAGSSLAQFLQRQGPLPETRALHSLKQAASAIAALHSAGLYHLDLSPHTLLKRDDSDDLAVIEFGLTCELSPGIQQTHANLLSPGYAAPEQYRADSPATPAADIYALAATLYCLLTGSPPPPAPLLEHIPADDWQQFPVELSNSTKGAILQGLILDSAQRPQSVEAWLSLFPAETPPAETATANKLDAKPEKTRSPGNPRSSTRSFKPLKLYRHFAKRYPFASFRTPPAQPQTAPKFPLRALILTCAIAASAGAGLGLSVRLNRPEESGSSPWHLKQSFPPREIAPSSPDDES
ncbi:MAG: serine/threonine-protein kinase [Cyanobacteriota bacterium]|nr:serine/threonine-protein kinase [Cyanobacteriota bacterium]